VRGAREGVRIASVDNGLKLGFVIAPPVFLLIGGFEDVREL
jgi:hypothetical protein